MALGGNRVARSVLLNCGGVFQILVLCSENVEARQRVSEKA